MKRQAIIALKLLACIPPALLMGEACGHILENGLWPLAFFPDSWFRAIDIFITRGFQIAAFAGLIRYWALGR